MPKHIGLKSKELLLIIAIFLICSPKTEAQRQSMSNVRNSVQVIFEGGLTYVYNFDTTNEELKKFIGLRLDMQQKTIAEQSELLQKKFIPFLRVLMNHTDKSIRFLKQINQTNTAEFQKLSISQSQLQIQIESLEEKIIVDLKNTLAKIMMSSEQLVTIDGKLDEIVRILKDRNSREDSVKTAQYRLIEVRDSIAIAPWKRFYENGRTTYLTLGLGTGLSGLRMNNAGTPISFRDGFSCSLSVTLFPLDKLEQIAKPFLSLNFHYISMSNGRHGNYRETLKMLLSEVKVGTNLLVSKVKKDKSKEYTSIPIGLTFAGAGPFQFRNNFKDYQNYAQNAHNANTDIKRLSTVMLGVFGGLNHRLVHNHKRRDQSIGVTGCYYLTDFFKKSFTDEYNYQPYKNLLSKLFYAQVTYTIAFH